jgi:hypothetical protein
MEGSRSHRRRRALSVDQQNRPGLGKWHDARLMILPGSRLGAAYPRRRSSARAPVNNGERTAASIPCQASDDARMLCLSPEGGVLDPIDGSMGSITSLGGMLGLLVRQS